MTHSSILHEPYQPSTSEMAELRTFLHSELPSPPDERYRLAAARRNVWAYSRSERLSALAARTRTLTEYIHRTMADEFFPSVLDALDRRAGILEKRFRKLSAAARKARREERYAAALARDIEVSARLDAMGIPRLVAGPTKAELHTV